MTQNADRNDDSTIKQGGGGILERGRPDGLGKPSDDVPILPSPERVTIPPDFPRRKK